ncbi:MAG: YceI family protein [Candidatus Paceibacterota bacterium]
MKIAAIIVVLILLGAAAVLIFSPKAPKDVQNLQVEDTNTQTQATSITGAKDGNIELTSFSYVGYGPGKSHTGVFEEYEVRNVKVNEAGVPVAGELVIQTASVKTDTAMLDTHLMEKAEFFDSAKYPEIIFTLSNATEIGKGTYQVSGDLKVKDITKKVGFTVNAMSAETFSAEFKLNMNDFGFTAPGIVDEEVLIKFAGKVN